MTSEKLIMFRNRLTKVFRHLSKKAKKQGVNCYRIYDHDLPEFPFCIEWYGDNVYVAEYKRHHGLADEAYTQWMEKSLEVIAEVLAVKKENIFLKLRRRKAGRRDQYQKTDAVHHESVVTENGLQFIINLSDYLDTGLFLDHRITRQTIKEQSAGKKVLNLFAYTGSFSVYAAAGGADEVVTVDLSKTYLNQARRNMQQNGFTDNSKYQFISADVKQYLKTIPAGYYDIIIMDSPTFSNSKRMNGFLDIQQDYAELIMDCLNGMKKGGKLYFSTNFRKFILNREKIKAGVVKDITTATTPFDFEGKLFRWCYYIEK